MKKPTAARVRPRWGKNNRLSPIVPKHFDCKRKPQFGEIAVIVATCEHKNRRTNGITKAGATRYRCKDCGKSWTESTDKLNGLRIGLDRAAKVIQLLCEGMSVLATSRLTGVCKGTILELLLYVGPKCDEYMQANIKGVYVDNVQVDEIWQYVFCKNATAKRLKYVGGCGDC